MPEDDDEDHVIVVRCSRCTTMETPPLDVVKRACTSCGAKVWVEKALPAEIAKQYPDQEIKLICMECKPMHGAGPVQVTDGQVARLLQTGLTPKQVAQALALADVSGGLGTLEENAIDIALFPNSDKADKYRKALVDMTVRVAGIMRRN